MAYEDCRWEFKIVEESGDIAAVMLDRAFVRPAGRRAVAAQIARHYFMAGF
jgi:hypothetical protein